MRTEQDNAVQSYIDALLFEAPQQELPSANGSSISGAVSEVDKSSKAPAKLKAGISTDFPAPAVESLNSGSIKSRAFVRHLELAQQGRSKKHTSQQASSRQYNGPDWAEDTVMCLLVKTANLKLAIPCQFIESVEPINDAYVALSAAESTAADDEHYRLNPEQQSDSVLGVFTGSAMRPDQGACYLIDTAKIVMPERYAPDMRSAYRHAVLIKDMDCALAVDSIGAEVEYAGSKVRWRSSHTRRAWLAGTVIEDMCAIVDIDAIHRSILADSVLADQGSATTATGPEPVSTSSDTGHKSG